MSMNNYLASINVVVAILSSKNESYIIFCNCRQQTVQIIFEINNMVTSDYGVRQRNNTKYWKDPFKDIIQNYKLYVVFHRISSSIVSLTICELQGTLGSKRKLDKKTQTCCGFVWCKDWSDKSLQPRVNSAHNTKLASSRQFWFNDLF